MIITSRELEDFNNRYRAQLINSLPSPKAAVLIGTKSSEGKTNLAIFNSVVHIGANPAALGFIMRPHTVERHTLENIEQTSFYTINTISSQFYEKAHLTAAKYEREVSEFSALNLLEEYVQNFHAPAVAQSNIQIGMKHEQTIPITFNNTLLIVGRIAWLQIHDEAIEKDGSINHELLDAVVVGGLDTYYQVNKLNKLDYPKPL